MWFRTICLWFEIRTQQVGFPVNSDSHQKATCIMKQVSFKIITSWYQNKTCIMKQVKSKLLRYNIDQYQKMTHIIKQVRPIVSQLDKCLKFTAFREVILYSLQSFLSPQIDLNFRHLSSCDTINCNVTTSTCIKKRPVS